MSKRSSRPARWTAVLIMGALCVVLGGGLLGCKKADETKPETKKPGEVVQLDGKKLLEERCVKCHDMERIDKASYDHDGWAKVIATMLKKPNGDVLNKEEAAAVEEYLAHRPPPAE